VLSGTKRTANNTKQLRTMAHLKTKRENGKLRIEDSENKDAWISANAYLKLSEVR
jgi:hypothetical protein